MSAFFVILLELKVEHERTAVKKQFYTRTIKCIVITMRNDKFIGLQFRNGV